LDSWQSDLLQTDLEMKLFLVGRQHVPQCPIAGHATVIKPLNALEIDMLL